MNVILAFLACISESPRMSLYILHSLNIVENSFLLLNRVLDDQTREDLDVKNVQVHVPFRAIVSLH